MGDFGLRNADLEKRETSIQYPASGTQCPKISLPAMARQIVGAGLSRPNDRRRKAAPTRKTRSGPGKD